MNNLATAGVSRAARQLVDLLGGGSFCDLHRALVLQITLMLQSCRLQWYTCAHGELLCECRCTVGTVDAPLGLHVHMYMCDPCGSMKCAPSVPVSTPHDQLTVYLSGCHTYHVYVTRMMSVALHYDCARDAHM